MRRFLVGFVLVLNLVQAQDVSGVWLGSIATPDTPLEVRVVLEQAGSSWQGTIDIPAQDSFGLPLDPVLVERGAITFGITGIPGNPSFDGLAEPDTIEGVFTQSGERFSFSLRLFTGLPEEAVLKLGQQYTDLFYAGDMQLLRSYFSETLKPSLTEKALLDFAAQIKAQAGLEQRLIDERVTVEDGYTIYERSALFDSANLVVRWVMDDNGVVEGFFIRPNAASAAPSDYLDYQTKTALRLPFDDAMTVVWGGRTVAQNYHAAYLTQRFAYDFLVVKNGLSHQGNGDSLEQYYCYGVPIIAPAAGTVVVAVDTQPDLPIGEMDAENATGNHIVIDHGNGEFSLLAHLQSGSVRVKEGETVSSGQPIAACGNSGNSSEPHLHYQLQLSATPADTISIPAQFQTYLADGVVVERGEPVQGQSIAMP